MFTICTGSQGGHSPLATLPPATVAVRCTPLLGQSQLGLNGTQRAGMHDSLQPTCNTRNTPRQNRQKRYKPIIDIIYIYFYIPPTKKIPEAIWPATIYSADAHVGQCQCQERNSGRRRRSTNALVARLYGPALVATCSLLARTQDSSRFFPKLTPPELP